MDTIDVEGVQLAYDETGQGAPVVCVHGAWTDRHAWDAVAPMLARRYRVIAYDRRGHSDSQRPPGIQGVDVHAADLAALIAGLGAAPAHILASSFGCEIALRLAMHHPDRVASLCLHEPPTFGVLDDDPASEQYSRRLGALLDDVVADIEGGRHEAAARRFVETIAVGPGGWELLLEQVRQTMAFNAPTFLDVVGDPTQGMLDRDELAAITAPVLLTGGAQTPSATPHAAVNDALAAALPYVERYTFAGAGHIPHRTHADELARVAIAFLDEVTSRPDLASVRS